MIKKLLLVLLFTVFCGTVICAGVAGVKYAGFPRGYSIQAVVALLTILFIAFRSALESSGQFAKTSYVLLAILLIFTLTTAGIFFFQPLIFQTGKKPKPKIVAPKIKQEPKQKTNKLGGKNEKNC